MSNESTNLKHRSLLRRTNHQDVEVIEKPYSYAQAAYSAKDVHVRTSRLTRKRHICKAQAAYIAKAVYVRTSRLTRKSRTTYAKPYTYAQAA